MFSTFHQSKPTTMRISNTSIRQADNGDNTNKPSLRRVLLFFPIVVICLGWLHLVSMQCPTRPSTTEGVRLRVEADTNRRRKQRKIFIDLGVNCGNSYHLFRQGDIVGSRTTLSDNDWEAYLWEANPQLVEWYLNDLVQTERAAGRHVELIPKAAATQNTTLSFFLTKGQEIGTAKDKVPNSACDPKSSYNPSGASSLYGSALRAGQEIKVEAVDFFAWFTQLQLQAHDIVHVKVDIEGAELDIIEVFLKDETNQICFWSQFWTEYHASIFPIGSVEYKRHVEFRNTFPIRFEDKCGRPLWPNGVLK